MGTLDFTAQQSEAELSKEPCEHCETGWAVRPGDTVLALGGRRQN